MSEKLSADPASVKGTDSFQEARFVREAFLRVKAEAERAAARAGREPGSVAVMAVTKTVAPELVNEAVAAGCVLLGENRVQELLKKYESYDLRHAKLHFIGRLQTNKVKFICDKVAMIESVDSLKLASEIEKQCAKLQKVMDVLLEINIAGEESKAGFSVEEAVAAAEGVARFPHLRLRGLMTIGRADASEEERKAYFARMRKLLVDIAAKNSHNISINILSMGMSGDYAIAAGEGATIVRVGRVLFGERAYQKSEIQDL